jgi:hypothetical protein
MQAMRDLIAGDLTIRVSEPELGRIRLDWQGKSTAREPSKILTPFFETVAERAAQARAGVEMHFEKLEHFNSSTITSLIQYIQNARSRGLPLVVVYDPQLKWQRLSFDALRIFDKNDGILSFKSAQT